MQRSFRFTLPFFFRELPIQTKRVTILAVECYDTPVVRCNLEITNITVPGSVNVIHVSSLSSQKFE